MTDKLKFRQHCKAAARLLCPWEANTRDEWATVCFLFSLVMSIGFVATRDTLVLTGALSLLVWLYGFFLFIRVMQLVTFVILWKISGDPLVAHVKHAWRALAEEDFFFAQFRHRQHYKRGSKKYLREQGFSRREIRRIHRRHRECGIGYRAPAT